MQQPILDALRRGAHDEALALAGDAVAAAPGDAQAHRLLSMAQRAAGDPEAGRASIERAIALAPEDAELHLHHAGYLLGTLDGTAANDALEAAVRLDPNQLGAYYLQAQLALGRNDLDEAERLARLAARVQPEHPWLLALQGTIALRRDRVDDALALLGRASTLAPEDAQVRLALGFAYTAKGHAAFAEQAFRGVIAAVPGATMLHALVAGLLQQQGRMVEAADELQPIFNAGRGTPAMHRYAGELELVAGRPAPAIVHLQAALAGLPGDHRTLAALLEALRLTGDAVGARAVLDAALATAPGDAWLWKARLSLESDAQTAGVFSARWVEAMPTHVPALQARMAVHANLGEAAAAEDVAARIVVLAPGHAAAELRLFDAMLERDPAAAVERAQALIAAATDARTRRLMRARLAHAHDRAGNADAAVMGWLALHQDVAAERLPLPALSPGDAHRDAGFAAGGDAGAGADAVVAVAAAAGGRPPTPVSPISASPADEADAANAADAPAFAFLVGAPGSGVDQVAHLIAGSLPAFRGDRFGPTPPDDPFQNHRAAQQLISGELDTATAAARWRDALVSRGPYRDAIDWLLWWDNAFASVLAAEIPEALLLVAVRDPRDMLLDWLAFEAPTPLRLESSTVAAGWLAASLGHVADLHAQSFGALRLLRLDALLGEPAALAAEVADALSAPIRTPPRAALGPLRFAPGHWRAYAGPLGDAFSILGPVAVRLGYPAD